MYLMVGARHLSGNRARPACRPNCDSKKPEAVVEKAVRGMLPKSRLGNAIFKNLFVYAADSHPHEAQQPKELDLNKIK